MFRNKHLTKLYGKCPLHLYFVYVDAHFVSVLSACIFIVCFAFDKVLLKNSTTTTTTTTTT